MSRYSLSLPTELKQDAERFAAEQGISLNQFILWAVAEKVGGLSRGLDDSRFPQITYRKGAGGGPVAVLRGSGARIRTLWAASTAWGWSPEVIAREYGLRLDQVHEALAFAAAHRGEIEADLSADEEPARANA
ncbi:MAG TPA: DUF433 domain-containing protein [Thermoanaerobaculia bacterium]|nr:DUF433 domain-containing protein [Thermoanaerobaculia bacterium]